MEYKKGDKVKHPKQEIWGIGVVLENQHDDKVRIFFEHIGEKILSTKFISPTKVTGEEAKNTLLDAFKDSSKISGVALLLHNFLLKFPEGFQDKDFITKEVVEKEKISKYAHKYLSKEIFSTLLADSKYLEITKIIKKIIQKDTFSMISPFEKMELVDHLENIRFQVELSDALYALLYDDEEESFDQNFVEFVEVLEEMKSAKWTILTYFLFIFFPNKHTFIKPTVTQHIAKICEFDLQYDAELNINTYQHALSLSNYLYDNLIKLGAKPKDMLDIQAFMWVVEKY